MFSFFPFFSIRSFVRSLVVFQMLPKCIIFRYIICSIYSPFKPKCLTIFLLFVYVYFCLLVSLNSIHGLCCYFVFKYFTTTTTTQSNLSFFDLALSHSSSIHLYFSFFSFYSRINFSTFFFIPSIFS